MKLNAAKCQFLQEKTTFLGHVVSREGVTTDPEKTKALLQHPEPSDVSRLFRVCNALRWLRSFKEPKGQVALWIERLENPPPITCSTAEKQKQQSWLTYWKKSDIELHQKEDLDIYQTLEWMKAGTRPKREEIVGTIPTIGNLWSQLDRLRLEDGLL